MRLTKNKGFTLIELMIVVVIIGIIAAIGYPGYQRYVMDSRMATAQADLMELAQWMERRYPLNNSYADAVLPFNVSPREGNTVAYRLTFQQAPTQGEFTIQAVPDGRQAAHRCGTLTLNQANERTAGDTNCWR
jgi:type IV pilus assembly protein PilE